MEIILKRLLDSHGDTSGILFLNGIHYGFTLEDTFRHEKIEKITRIPAGRYEIKLRKGSPMAQKYLARYGTNGMIHLQDVPGFQYVYIHIGNTDEESEGCILVANMLRLSIKNVSKDGEYQKQLDQIIMDSTTLYKSFHSYVSEVLETERVFITILDN